VIRRGCGFGTSVDTVRPVAVASIIFGVVECMYFIDIYILLF